MAAVISSPFNTPYAATTPRLRRATVDNTLRPSNKTGELTKTEAKTEQDSVIEENEAEDELDEINSLQPSEVQTQATVI